MKLPTLSLTFLLPAVLASAHYSSPHSHTKVTPSTTANIPIPSNAALPAAPKFTYDELWAMQNDFYGKFMYPNNVAEVKSVNSTVFSLNVQGRVSQTRTFSGRELNTEYIFGLFVPHDGLSIVGSPLNYTIQKFVANQNIASASTAVEFSFPSFGNITLPVVIDTYITWDANKAISQYDVTFKWFDFLVSTLLTKSNLTQSAIQSAVAESVCNDHGRYCNGTNQQYASHEACTSFLTGPTIRLGQTYELGMNTLMCRSLHQIMLQYRPAEHCSHVGPTGGGMCTDNQDYLQKVTESYFNNSAWIAQDPK